MSCSLIISESMQIPRAHKNNELMNCMMKIGGNYIKGMLKFGIILSMLFLYLLTVQRFTVNTTLRQMPGDCIKVTLEEWCEGDHGDYGVDVLYQDLPESSIIRFEQSDTICVPIVVGQTFSVRLYFNDDIVEQVEGLMAGMLYSPTVLAA